MWSGSNPTAPNWKGDNQLPGGEELYFVPAVSNTTDINKIGIVDGNLIEMPTSYPYLQVALLETTNIENAENIITDNIDCNTINNNPVPVDASQWSLYPAIHQVEMETYALKNASSVEANVVLKVGTATTGGSLNIGTDNYNPASAPSVSIGNSTIGKSSTNIYGANNLTGYGALSVTGGVTLDAGSITANSGTSIHGINMYAAQVVDGSPSTVRMTLGETGVSIYTAQPEVQGISINALASAVTINTGTELTTRSVLGTEIEAGTGVYVSGLTAGSYNDGRMFIQHICPAYAETTNLLIDGANDLTSGRTGVELRDGVVVDTAVLNVTNINDKDTGEGISIVSASGNLHLEANDGDRPPHDITILSTTADVNIQAGGNIVLDTLTPGGADVNISSNRDINISGHRTIEIYAQGETGTSLYLESDGFTGLYSYGGNVVVEASADVNMNAQSGNINLTANADGGAVITLTASQQINLSSSVFLHDVYDSGGGNIQFHSNVDLLTSVLYAGAVSSPDVYATTLHSYGGGGLIYVGDNIDMATRTITNLGQLNGHNLYSYGKFYNTASQSLTATGTATRVKLNTAGTSSGITLDTSTNIGRLTFSNAGTYQVTWNGYLVRASGTANNFIWIRLNGTDVAGTGKKQRTDAGLSEISIGGSTQVTVTSGQYIEFFWAADDTNTSLTSYAASSPYPAIPGFSCAISIIA